MNKDLKDREFLLPDNIKLHLQQQLSNKGADFEGIKRARNLLNDGKVNYGQLKRIVHDIKNIDKNKEFDKYNLYGGELMEKWGNTILDTERDFVKSRKESKKRSDVIGSITGERKNAFLSTHTKKQSMIPPLNPIKSNSEKSSVSSLKLAKLFEEIIKK